MIVTPTRFSLLKIEDEKVSKNKNEERQFSKTEISKQPHPVAKNKRKNKNILGLDVKTNSDFISKESQLVTNFNEKTRKDEPFTLITKKRGIKKKNALSLEQFCSVDSNGCDTSMWTSKKPLASLITNSLDTKTSPKVEATYKDNNTASHDGVPFYEILNLTRENAELKAKLLECVGEKANSDKLYKDLQDKNSKLTILYENTQIKEKAELIIQIEELLTTHNDLSKEIAELNGELQKEKSKTHQAELLVKSLQQQIEHLHQDSNPSHTLLTNSHYHQQSAHHHINEKGHHQIHDPSSAVGSHKYQRGHIK